MSDVSAIDSSVKNANIGNNSVEAKIKDGKVENTETKKAKEKSAPSGYDKDSFLKILVAQMKYQDPMEPTSNTEYISQYATFSQVEQLNNMANAMNLSRASEMVGKTVKIKQTNAETGKTTEAEGVVDFVTYSGNKAYLNINGINYDVDDVTEVLSSEYAETVAIVNDFQKNVDKLPVSLDAVSYGQHGSTIDSLYEFYNKLDDETKALIGKDYETAINQYENRISDLRNSFNQFASEIDNLPEVDEIDLDAHGKKIDSLYDRYLNFDIYTRGLVGEERRTVLFNSVNKVDDLRGNTHRV